MSLLICEFCDLEQIKLIFYALKIVNIEKSYDSQKTSYNKLPLYGTYNNFMYTCNSSLSSKIKN